MKFQLTRAGRGLLAGMTVALAVAGMTQAEGAGKPNIVIVYTDDQGYQDLSCYGSPTNHTPNIDRLAAEGMRFTDFYSAYCVCSASRASLMTGCYQPRLSMPGVLGPHSKVALNPDEVTIAEMLKPLGYATMCIGKWHLGDSAETLPTSQGFDHYFGIPYSNDMGRSKEWSADADGLDKMWEEKRWDVFNNDLYRDTEVIEHPVNQTTITERYTEEAVKFITEHKDGPFFLYLPQSMVHVPLFVSDDRYVSDPHEALRLAVEHVDWSVGQLMKTLDELGIKDNTIFMYSSDNGPWLSKKHHAGSALPLRDGKATTWDGGMRVPGIFRWPGHIPAGATNHEVASTIDVLPTLAAITGAALPDHPIDGLDVSVLLKDPGVASPHRKAGFYYYKNSTIEGVRQGKWKLHVKNPKSKTPEYELFDLEADIGETTDVSAAHPEVVADLKALSEKYDADLKANSRPAWHAAEAESK